MGHVHSGSELVVFKQEVWHGLNSDVGDDLVLHPRHRPEKLGEGAFVGHRLHDHEVHPWVFVPDVHPAQACESTYHVDRPLVDVVSEDAW